MAKPTVKFMSYNSTGLNNVKCRWISDLMQTCDVSFCGIQEHFKKTRSLMSFFKTAFPEFNASVQPGHREEGRDTGRAQGGLAQLSSKRLKVQRECVNTASWRLQAQILDFGGYKLLWMNVYFPSDPQVLNYNDAELQEIQCEVEKVLEAGGYDDCVCGGDWNYDCRRTSGFAASMHQFLLRAGLVSVWEKFPVDFTHLHTDNKSTSILDNFFVNERLLQFVESAAPVHLGDNLSRHSPIILSLRLDDIPRTRSSLDEKVEQPRRLAWKKAEPEQVGAYSAKLLENLRELEPPASIQCLNVKCSNPAHSKERDRFVLDVMSAVIEASHSTIALLPQPQSNKSHQQPRLPGWRENVEPLKKDCKFWHAVWLSAGRPTTGALHAVMVNSRIKYRCALRRAQSQANKEKAKGLLDAAMAGDKMLMQQMRRAMGCRKSAQEVPCSLEGTVGDSAICEKFRSLYEELYNSCSSEGEMTRLLQDLEEKINCQAEGEVSKVTAAVVRRACARMKGGRLDVTQAYTSDVFLHGPNLLHDHLASIFQSFLVHGTVPLNILVCSFMPLLKAGKSPVKFDSYRAVAGASQLLKLFEYVILDVWGDCLNSDTVQFGFKTGTGTDQCSWLLLTTAEYFVQRGSTTLCCLLDVSKGFDRVKFCTLFTALLEKVPAIVVRVLAFSYMEQAGFVRLAGLRSSSFRLRNGTRQGAVASPALWAIYVNDLLLELRRLKLGCYVAGVWIGAVMYVDDLALLAPTRAVLVDMLAVVEKFGISHNLKFSTDPNPKLSKTKCIAFGARPNRALPAPVKLYGKELPWVESALHLGHTLHQSLSMAQDTRVRRAVFISRSVEVRDQLGFAVPESKLKAVQVMCCDAYGSSLWRLDSPASTSFFKAWSSCVRRVFRLPVNTFTYLVEGHLAKEFVPLRNMVLGRYPGFYRRLLDSPSKEVRMMAELAAGHAQTVTAGNLSHLRHLTGLDPVYDSLQHLKQMLPRKEVPEKEEWRLGLLDQLLILRGQQQGEGGDAKRVTALLSSLCST